jgi:microcystin-dependent protein
MTVQNTIVKDIYVGNGATTKFPITFQMTDHPEYIKVYITGDDSVAVETENFSVDLGAKTVTYPANGYPLPDGHKITIYRELPLYQLMNLVNQGPFFAENIELSFDDLTFICQQLNEKLNRTLSAGIDVSNFNNTFPVKAGMSFRINDAGDGLVLTEDPARVLPLAKDVLEQTKQVKESAVNETTNIKNTAIEELTAIKNAAVNETTEIKDEAVAAKNTAVEAAATAAEDAVNNVQTLLDEKVAAAENAKSVAVSSAESALASKNAAAASQSSAAASAETAQASAESASSSADAALASKNAALTSENNAKASETKSAKSEESAKAAETAAENSKKSASDSASAASSSAESALESKTLAAASANSASASKTSAESSAESAASSATTATRQADRAQDIADSLEGLAGITGIATTEEAIAGESDTKAMTPLKTKEAIKAQVPIQTIIDSIYIVGQIVEYASNVNPNDLYPWQTWEQIKDVFTLASGDKYSIGQTGGVSTVTLTVAQIPEHIHTASVQNASLTGRINGSANSSNGYNNNPLSGSGVFSGSGAINGYGEGGEWNSGTATWAGLNFGGTHNHDISIETTGGGEAHNNMPPYLVTIKWKRTA